MRLAVADLGVDRKRATDRRLKVGDKTAGPFMFVMIRPPLKAINSTLTQKNRRRLEPFSTGPTQKVGSPAAIFRRCLKQHGGSQAELEQLGTGRAKEEPPAGRAAVPAIPAAAASDPCRGGRGTEK